MKLKNETTARKAMRKKLRYEKKDHSFTNEELVKMNKLQRQGRKKAMTEVGTASIIRRETIRNEDDNVGTKSLQQSLGVIETGIYEVQKNHYSNKIHDKKVKKSNQESKNVQKKKIRKDYEVAAYKKQTAENVTSFGSINEKVVDKVEQIARLIADIIKEHPMEIMIAVAIMAAILVVVGSASSCSIIAGGVENITIVTSYTAEDDQILAVDRNYAQLESDLQSRIDSIESDYPNYDEYRYNLANINHNPFQLAALLTVLYEDYTEVEVQEALQNIFDSQYELSIQRIVETRTKTETKTGYNMIYHEDGSIGVESYTYEEEVEYDYYVLQTILTNTTMDTVVKEMGLITDQIQRYELLLETYGNKKYLFEDDIYSNVELGEFMDYEIPPNTLTDQKFANMIREAEKYLGYPYVWGGCSPSTSFDCSGFVSYVINNCGNGWNIGRQTANGLLNSCTIISTSEASPGDLIFFQGTYDTSGVSHVGIYVGNGMMLHCGNPIQYVSINSSYWQSHFYAYGRINE